jgi:hypothetical protein
MSSPNRVLAQANQALVKRAELFRLLDSCMNPVVASDAFNMRSAVSAMQQRLCCSEILCCTSGKYWFMNEAGIRCGVSAAKAARQALDSASALEDLHFGPIR